VIATPCARSVCAGFALCAVFLHNLRRLGLYPHPHLTSAAFLGEEQRRIPPRTDQGKESVLQAGTAIGGAPWLTQEQQNAQKE
jgi:hypothetical protein